jgi:hypothetical protein
MLGLYYGLQPQPGEPAIVEYQPSRIAALRRLLSRLVLGCWLLQCLPAAGEGVSITVGPTAIPRGEALGESDVTIDNGLFAIAVAVDTAPPWGVPRGGIVDIALVEDGVPGPDIASLVDFMPNNWSSWPNSYQRIRVQRSSDREVVVHAERDWGAVELETRFTVRAGDRRVQLHTRMTNRGKTVLKGLMSGFVAWPDGGHVFGVPGLSGRESAPEKDALADWSAAYDARWVLGLHAPFATHTFYDGRDRYLSHALDAGESVSFGAWLQVEPGGSLAPLIEAEIEFRGAEHGTLAGRVSNTRGEPVAEPAVVVYSDGRPYAWALGEGGHYALTLPVGDYQVHATAASHGSSAARRVTMAPGSRLTLDFDDLQEPATVRFTVRERVSREPLDARIRIVRGARPLIRFFGRSTFFTGLEEIGTARVEMAPGGYQLEVSSGGGFTSLPQLLEVAVEPGRDHAIDADIPVLLRPAERGWYSADLHHHSDVLDGFTEPRYVVSSELAAALDFTFLSDHDAVVNNPEMRRLSALRGVPFIAGTEFSPSWAHFNAYPLDEVQEIAIDVASSSVQQIFAEARRMGADVVHVNHPYIEYGYFRNLEAGEQVPGGYYAGFDLVEINGEGANRQTLLKAWQLWNQGQRAYLAAGSDAHDVWEENSGAARSYVRIDGEPTVAAYIAGLKSGRSYASQGPLVYPQILFGSELTLPVGAPLRLAYSVHAVSGLRAVRLVERGEETETRVFDAEVTSAEIEFLPRPQRSTWYSLVVEDAAGKFAYTNPVWVEVGN